MLGIRHSTAVAVSSSAPMYSAVVTAPLIIAAVGGWAPYAYVLAAIPAAWTCYSMAVNNAAIPDKGTVYTWAYGRVSKWSGGFSLAVTGIISTAGTAYVGADLLLGEGAEGVWPVLARIGLAGVMIVGAMGANLASMRMTALAQAVTVGLQVAGIAVLLWMVWTSGPVAVDATAPSTAFDGAVSAWVQQWGFSEATAQTTATVVAATLAMCHAILLAVFAYWGFDSVFSLAEESEATAPRAGAWLSMVFMIAFYVSAAFGTYRVGIDRVVHNPVIAAAVVASAVMALGSTMIPTVRGMQAMAERGNLPARLISPTATAFVVVSLTWLCTSVTVVTPGLFWDAIDGLSIFVGLYFVISSVSAWQREGKKVHIGGAILMGLITVATLVQTVGVDYGETTWLGVGGVFWMVLAIAAAGVVGYVKWGRFELPGTHIAASPVPVA